MTPWFLLSIVPLVVLGVYLVWHRHAAFVVRFGGGTARAVRGQMTRRFLREIAEACARHGVRRGTIRGIPEGRRINLVFSPGIPEPCRQQIRNLWGVSGWSAPGPGRPNRTA